MSLSILIIDPDQTWVTTLKDHLSSKLCSVDVASNGKDAQLQVYKKKYEVAIIDLETNSNSWIEVLRYIKLNAPQVKIILTIKNPQLLNKLDMKQDDLKKLGASHVFTKPIMPDTIYKSIQSDYKIESWKDIKPSTESKGTEEVKAIDEEFTRIKFENFLSGSTTILDHYIRIGKNQFIKILHRGETFDQSRLKQYKDSNLDYLYFRTSDRITYINFTNQFLKKIIGTESGTIEKKVQYTKSVVEKYMEQVVTTGMRPNLVDEGKLICENMYALIQSEPELNKIMKSFEDYDPPAFAHTFLVSFFSVITCKNLEWASSYRTIESIGLASLLHDIGELKLPTSLKNKKPAQMSKEELAIYQTHPQLGADMLAKFPVISDAVKQIVYQHHEHINGEGFPNKLNGLKIYPPAKIVALSDEFAKFLVEQKLTPLEGLKIFLRDKSVLARFDPMSVKALVSGFIKDK